MRLLQGSCTVAPVQPLLGLLALLGVLLLPSPLHATVLAELRGIVHDPQHRPLSGAQATIAATASSFHLTTTTNGEGIFEFDAVPFGEYTVTVSLTGFATQSLPVSLASGTSAVLHFPMAIARVQQQVKVTASSENVDSVTPTTLVSRAEIALTPGADRPGSMQMITDYVPGAYMTHDMLHIRGGHQVSWLLDGVQIPNTNIASNVGPQIAPSDIDYLEAQRGSYGAENGDRTYGVFNVAPRTGWERDRQGELLIAAGNFYNGDSQLSLGDHDERLAWYASLNGNRSNYGLAPPVAGIFHDAANGYGGLGSLVYNRTPRDQFRLLVQARGDYFQIPYDPDPASIGNSEYQSAYLRDGQHESDALSAFTWARTFQSSTLLQISPFYHYNSAEYEPSATDLPVATTSDRETNYAGVQSSIGATIGRNTLQAGLYSWGQHDSYVFAAAFNDGTSPSFRKPDSSTGGLVELYLSDSVKASSWLTVIAGLRESRFQAQITDTYTAPRFGLALLIPHLNWTLRGFYGRFYQPPPLLTAAGPVEQFAEANDTAIVPLHGERDEEHQFGVQVPFRGWTIDADNFRTRVNNFLDHSNIGESSIYFPVTVNGALIRGWELTVRSPRLWGVAGAHLAYSNQIAEQRGNITGGLICTPAGSPQCDAGFSYSPVDHDQRNTLSAGFNASLPAGATASINVSYGSGFTNGSPDARYPGAYLPAHSAVDLAVGKRLGERASVTVTATNVTNHRTLLDNSLTFGGFHYNDPRQLDAEFRYRFHF
ncbi:MAG TPA: TonB-dependent receptor [Acidisarcina sp.]